MQVNHPWDGVFVVSRIEYLLGGALSNLLKATLLLVNLHLQFVNHVVAALLLIPHYLIHLLFDTFLNPFCFLLAVLEVLIIALTSFTIPPQEAHHELSCPECLSAPTWLWLSTNLIRESISLHVLSGKHSTKFAWPHHTLVHEHGESHFEDIVYHADVTEHIV